MIKLYLVSFYQEYQFVVDNVVVFLVMSQLLR